MGDIKASDTLREWTESAPYWDQYGATICTMFAPITRALIADAGITKGHSVLDVAGGPGEPSLTIAETVAPSGSVMCTDAVGGMVQAATRAAHRRQLTNISFRQCTADSLPFSDDSFDVVVSRLGIMFFPDPLASLMEMLRVTKPGGALALAVWHKSELNPFFHIVADIMSNYVEASPTEPDAPGAFRFAEPGKLANVLTKAGAISVRERVLEFDVEAPVSLKDFWQLRSATSGTLREKLAGLTEGEVTRVARDVIEAVQDFFPNGQMKFPAQMILVTGRKR